MAQTLGFYRLDDFAAELKRRGIGRAQTAVRCEAVTRDIPSNRQDVQLRRFVVALSAYDAPAGEVLACEIVVSHGLIIGGCAGQQHADNLMSAKQLVISHLDAQGLEVLPGEYAHDPTGCADCSLWRIDADRRLQARHP